MWEKVPTGNGEDSCEVGVSWRTTGEAMTRLIVDEYGRKYLLELPRQLWRGKASAHCWWSYDTSKCRRVWKEAPAGAGEGSSGVGVRWRTSDGAMTRLSVE